MFLMLFYYKTAMLLPFMHEFHPFMQSGLTRDFYSFMFVSGINNTGGQISEITNKMDNGRRIIK